ncbi:DUF4176 domain-containing protein [Streptococcus sp. CSL10205-OR2]|uniref:DUF4176 domain-containing protein n=1 Tax=Streptococcus sp. CSL10205-OR2 TaxID=2980558 RepID=UPI003988612C
MKYLPLGSVVQLKNGDIKLMITSRFPLYNSNGELGYFDYSSCIYPTGTINNQAYFFNQEDIAKVWFEGYVDDSEIEAQDIFEREKDTIPYNRLTIADLKK